MGNSKSRSSETPPVSSTETVEEITHLRREIEKSEKRIDYLRQQIARQLDLIKQVLKTDKKKALVHLKKKKLLEKQVADLENTTFNLHTLLGTIEGAVSTNQVAQALKRGASFLKRLHEQMSINNIDDVMDEIAELTTEGQEKNDILEQPVEAGFSQEELEAELEQMMDEMIEEERAQEMEQELTEQLLAPPKSQLPEILPVLPSVPIDPPVYRATKDEEAELAELEASMM